MALAQLFYLREAVRRGASVMRELSPHALPCPVVLETSGGTTRRSRRRWVRRSRMATGPFTGTAGTTSVSVTKTMRLRKKAGR